MQHVLSRDPTKTFSCQNLKNLRINKQVFTLLLTTKEKVSRNGYFLRSVKFSANLTCALKVFKLFKCPVVLYNTKSTSTVKHYWVPHILFHFIGLSNKSTSIVKHHWVPHILFHLSKISIIG